MPASGRMTRPVSINCVTIRAIVLTGIAKPTPLLWPVRLAIAVFMPINRLWLSNSGPPELPGLTADWTTSTPRRFRRRGGGPAGEWRSWSSLPSAAIRAAA